MQSFGGRRRGLGGNGLPFRWHLQNQALFEPLLVSSACSYRITEEALLGRQIEGLYQLVGRKEQGGCHCPA